MDYANESSKMISDTTDTADINGLMMIWLQDQLLQSWNLEIYYKVVDVWILFEMVLRTAQSELDERVMVILLQS